MRFQEATLHTIQWKQEEQLVGCFPTGGDRPGCTSLKYNIRFFLLLLWYYIQQKRDEKKPIKMTYHVLLVLFDKLKY